MALAPFEVRAAPVPLEVLAAPALLKVCCRLGGTVDSVGTADVVEAGLRDGCSDKITGGDVAAVVPPCYVLLAEAPPVVAKQGTAGGVPLVNVDPQQEREEQSAAVELEHPVPELVLHCLHYTI